MSDADGALRDLREPHCFDLTDALPIVDAVQQAPLVALEATLFLPARETWLEWRAQTGARRGYYLRTQPNGGSFQVFQFGEDGIEYIATLRVGAFGVDDLGASHDPDEAALAALVVSVCLAIINTPRLISRREHPPHRGLRREMARSDCSNIELRAWTEIRLEVTPRLATGDLSMPERLTGRKCLHFCRSHLRVQNGRLVVVRPHWRGDAALGVKQQDYRVVA